MKKRVKRWRLSDVVRACALASEIRYFQENAAQIAAVLGRDSERLAVRSTLRAFNLTLGDLLDVHHHRWTAMTDAEREALVVAEARRLKVPRRA